MRSEKDGIGLLAKLELVDKITGELFVYIDNFYEYCL